MDGVAQNRILVQPVRERVGDRRLIAPRAVQGQQRAGPVGVTPDQVGREIGRQIDVAKQRFERDLSEISDHATLRAAGQRVRLDVEQRRDPSQKSPADVPFVGLDQVEIRRRNFQALGELRLGQTERLALRADPKSHRRPIPNRCSIHTPLPSAGAHSRPRVKN